MKYIKGYGNLSFGSVKRPKRANGRIYGSSKVKKISWFCDFFSFFKDSALKAVKRDSTFQTRYVKGLPFVNRQRVFVKERGTFYVKNGI